MANWSNPTLTSTYTNFVTEVKDRDTDCATFLDGSTSTNLPTGAKRWNSTTNKFEKWSGSAWSDLATTYAIGISGTATTATNLAAGAAGSLPYQSGAAATTMLAIGANNTVLTSTGAVPAWTASTGTGSIVRATSPTFTTSATAPLVIGGTGTTSPLALRSTSGVGAAGADIIFQVGNNGATEAMRVLNSGNVGIGTAAPGYPLQVQTTSTTNQNTITLVNEATQNLSAIGWVQAGSNTLAYTSIYGDGRTTGYMAFRTNDTERMRIDSAGNLLISKTAANLANTGIEFKPGGFAGFTGNLATTNELVNFNNANTGNVAYDIAFRQQNVIVGSIRVNSASVSYNTTSDHRLKENVTPIAGALAKVAALKPVSYTWKVDGSDGEGFIAHELQAVCPLAVTGKKDAVGEDGKPIHQGIDPSKIIGLLTAAIQELKAELDALKAGLPAIPTASPPSP